MSLTPNEWTILEPSVIRDAVHGRLGFQNDFGTTFVSGATNALVLKQNPIDGLATEGDAVLYIGTTNGGVYMRRYDYQTDTWDDRWTWISEPSGSSAGGYDGAQGIGALAISPDGNFIAVGRGNSSNYLGYTPSGPALQIGRILSDGSVDWLANEPNQPTSGITAMSNIRELSWQNDALYLTTVSGANAPNLTTQFGRYFVNDEGALTGSEVLGSLTANVITSDSAGPDQPVFVSSMSGALSMVAAGSGQLSAVTSEDWEAIRQGRLSSGEYMARLTVAQDPTVDGRAIVLVGWISFPNDNAPHYITHVDRLVIDTDNTVVQTTSIDFSNKAGNNQAGTVSFYGNYSLMFDPSDPSFNTVLVGGNQYRESHPDGQIPYTSTGGLVRGDFSTQSVEAVFGPYRDANGQLVADSLLTGAPHADSRKGIVINTAHGVELIQSDDGGIWLFSPSPDDPTLNGWTSLTAPGLNALEVISTGWDARSNSFVSAFQDNSTSIGQLGDAFMSNVWAGDGMLSLMDGAMVTNDQALSWGYLNSQKYMLQGKVYGFGLNARGDVMQTEVLTMVTNWEGNSVQPIEWVETYALVLANPTVALDRIPGLASFKGPSTTNPYRQGDLVLAGDSGLYETFQANGSPNAAANATGTLQLVPVVPFSDANTVFTAVDLGSSSTYVAQHDQIKPFFWDSLLAVSWDKTTRQSTIWYRDPVSLDTAPASLADVDPTFLNSIALQPLTTSGYAIADIAHTVDAQGMLETAYWLEAGSTFLPPFATGESLQPSQTSDGAALVIYANGNLTRLPYAQTSGLDQLVQASDKFGPTSLELIPGKSGAADILVIGGEHGLYMSELNAQGMPVGFEAMSIDGLPSGVQFGSAVTGLVYNEQDQLLTASLLGGGTMLYSLTGDLQPTPTDDLSLKVSQTTVPQSLSESLDKRGNQVSGQFAIELPGDAFDDQGVAQVQFVIPDADLWRPYLSEVSFYLQASGTGSEFNLLERSGSLISETLTFNDFAAMRLGFFRTNSTIKQLPEITLDYQLNLLNGDGTVRQTLDSTINLVPNGSTPSFARYNTYQAEGSSSFQAQFSFGDGVELQKLPFGFKFGLPADLPEGTEVFAFSVADPTGTIALDDGTILTPTDPDYLTVGVPSQKISPETPVVSGIEISAQGLGINALSDLFISGDTSQYLASEGIYYGKMLNSLVPKAFDDGIEMPPILGIAIQYPDGSIQASTIDATSLQGNEVNLDPTAFDRGVVIDVGYGGIFAAQVTSGDISIAKLGRLDSAIGFVRVDDLFGHIGDLAPGDSGYVQAALTRSLQENLDLSLTQQYGSTASYTVDGFIAGTYYASFITPGYHTVTSALDAINSGQSNSAALFSFDAANVNSQGAAVSAAIPFAADMIAFEDMPTVGDLDFNDLVVYYGDLV